MDAALALATAAALTLGLWLVPMGNGLAMPGGGAPPSGCWLHETSGIECPTCGMTRSYVAFLHGDTLASLRWHPAGPLTVLASVAALAAVAFFWVRRRRPLWERRGFRTALTALALITLAAGTVRYFF